MKFSHILIITGFALWLAETVYFGFNLYAVSNAEKFFDNFSFALIVVGLISKIITINININK